MAVGTPKDQCPCREKEMRTVEISQCKDCLQIYHDRCFRQQREECNCKAATETVELGKRASIIDFDVEVVELPSPNKQVHSSNPPNSLPNIPKNQPKPSSLTPKSTQSNPLKPIADSAKRKAVFIGMYDSKHPMIFGTEIEKNRLKVKRILFESVLGSLEELIHNFDKLQFQFSADKVTAISTLSDEHYFDYVRNCAFELEGQLILLSSNPLSPNSAYLKKSRFLSIVFRQDKLNQLLVQYLLQWLTPKKLVSLAESDFSDKEKMRTYEARFWDGREIEEEELILKNYKVILPGFRWHWQGKHSQIRLVWREARQRYNSGVNWDFPGNPAPKQPRNRILFGWATIIVRHCILSEGIVFQNRWDTDLEICRRA